jgi:hypothetical protein
LRASKAAGFALACVTAIGLATSSLSAHRRDELLQAARIAIDQDRVEIELDLTPGIAIADAAIAGIDRDGDGRLSDGEQSRYVGDLLASIELDIDGDRLRPTPVSWTFPAVDAFKLGEGTIRVRAQTRLPRLATGEHHFGFRNRFRPIGSVYLANALVPRDASISITAQRRDIDQRELTIEYTLRTGPSTSMAWLLSAMACLSLLMAGWVATQTRR